MTEKSVEIGDLVKIIEESDFKEEKGLKEKLQVLFESFKAKATEILSDGGALQKICIEAEQWFEALSVSPKIKNELKYVPTFIDMLRAYAMKEYTDISLVSLIWILLAVVYCVAPVDFIPEVVVGSLGLIDDAGVVWFVLNKTKPDIDKYSEWRAAQN